MGRAGPSRGALLSDQWRGDAVVLFDVTNSTFHRNLLSLVSATFSLEEFYKARIEYPAWADMVAVRDGHNWTDQELALYMYTTEAPLIYRPMNKMMREARQMSDIDTYWQSYIAILRDGLRNYAVYLNLNTYRGVDCDAGDLLKVGEDGVLPSFTSTSSELRVAENFGCAVLHFTGGGYDLRKYSEFPGEAEVLIEQGRAYNVTRNVANKETGAVHVHLETEAVERSINVSVSKHRRTCEGLDLSQCNICQCCDRPPSSALNLQQRGWAVTHDGQVGQAQPQSRKHGLRKQGGLAMVQVKVEASGVKVPAQAAQET